MADAMTNAPEHFARAASVKTLEEVLFRDGFASLCISRTLKEEAMASSEEKAFYTSLVYTTLEHLETIDAILNARLKTGLKALKPYVQCVLRMALAQLKYMEKIPAAAAIHTAVELVKQSKFSGLAGLVNAVLRGSVREGFAFPLPDPKKDWASWASLQYEMPRDLCAFFGDGELLGRFRDHSETCLRVNLLKTDFETVAAQFEGAVLHPDTACIYVDSLSDPGQTEGFRKGLFTVQDEASVLSAMALGARPGERVWDMCAAPGSKTMIIASSMQNEGSLLATDLYGSRVALIEENAVRMGVSFVTARAEDASLYRPSELFDRILLDAPCSGLGLLGSKPDLKYHKPLSRFDELIPLERALLDNAFAALKPGGLLIYSTCTLNPQENEEQVKAFLERYPDMRLADVADLLPKSAQNDIIDNHYWVLKPIPHGRDGFFIAALQKTK